MAPRTYRETFSDDLCVPLLSQKWAICAVWARPWPPHRSSNLSTALSCFVCDLFASKPSLSAKRNYYHERCYLIRKCEIRPCFLTTLLLKDTLWSRMLSSSPLTSVLLSCRDLPHTVIGVVNVLRLLERIGRSHVALSVTHAHRPLLLDSTTYSTLCHLSLYVCLAQKSWNLFNSLMLIQFL